MRLERFLVLLLIVLTVFSCNGKTGKKLNPEYTSGEQVVSFAERLKIERKSNYTILTIMNPWQGADGIKHNYYLVRRGSVMPEGKDSSEVIFVPVNRIVCMSTTHIAMIIALGGEKTIRGVSGTGFVYSEALRPGIESGEVADVGYEGSLNHELILRMSPDLIMMYGVGSESVGYVSKIRELGVKVLFNADYLETDPLRKAEWIKLLGALYCKEEVADSIYNKEVESYNMIKAFIKDKVSSKPKVLLGLPYKETWFISPGNSFISQIIDDAGGEYLWQESISKVSIPMGLENVYLKSMNADYWLNIGSVTSRQEIILVDPRLIDIPCFRKGNLFNNNKRITTEGGNDYWESGSVFPHLILKDIATILHPELFINNELYYYRKIN